MYNKSGIWAASDAYKFITGARTSGVTGDPVFDITTQQAATADSLSFQNSLTYKRGNGKTFIPSFEWASGRLVVDGNGFYSSSVSTYDPQGAKGAAYVLSALAASGDFSATRE